MNCFGNKEEKYENPLEQEYENLFSQNNEDPFYVEESLDHGDIYGDINYIDNMSYRSENNILFGANELSSGQMDFEYVYDNIKENNGPNTSENSEKSTEPKTEKKPEKEKIFEITKEKSTKEPEEIKLLEKKREREGKHTKDSFDNIVRKIKSKSFGGILITLNKSLEEDDKKKEETPMKKTQKQKKGEIKNECFSKVDQNIIIDINVSSNLKLLDTPLREIFSQKVSKKMKNYSKDEYDYNKNFIEKIKNDEKKAKTNAILDLTYFQCLEHFRGSKKYEVLNGLEKEYEETIKDLKMKYDVDYMNNFIEHLNCFEILLKNKKPRKSRKNKNDEEI